MLEPEDELKNQNELILRDRLSLIRTKLANERTLFAYIRTFYICLLPGLEYWKLRAWTI